MLSTHNKTYFNHFVIDIIGCYLCLQINNAYDSTIVYTDYFLSKAIELLKANAKSHDGVMLYISDHGESLGENGVYLHGMSYFMAPVEQIHVPGIMWFDKNFAKEIDMEALEERYQ